MKQLIFTILFLLSFNFLFAQSKNVIDEVIWIVGDEAILLSEVEEQRLHAQYERTPIIGDPYCVIPEQIAIQKLYLHQAELDSITVNESAVLNQVENQISYYISQIGSREKVEEYFNKNIVEIRDELRDVVRNRAIIQQMQEKLVGDINSTPAEVRRFFNQMPADSIPMVPAQVELQVISMQPPIPQEETDRVKDRLREFTERINADNSQFSVLARMYSEDPGSAIRGGELDFYGRAELDPEYAAVAFSLQDPTRVSRIVESEFGFHIIQLMEKRGERIKTRHILLKPRVSQEDRNKATHRLDSVANLIRNSKMTFEQGVVYFSQDKNSAMNAGLMMNERTRTSKFEYQDLPPEIAKIVYSMKVGEISTPFSMMNQQTNKEEIVIVKLKSKIENHKANLTDDYQMLRMYYENKKAEELLEEWIRKKQKETYISIDPDWQNCEFQYDGWIK